MAQIESGLFWRSMDLIQAIFKRNKLPRSKLRGISLDLASLGIFVKRSKLRGIRPVSD